MTAVYPAIKRPPIISLLAVLQFIGGGFWMLGAAAGLISAVIGSGDPRATRSRSWRP
jgi:hypothetical protein